MCVWRRLPFNEEGTMRAWLMPDIFEWRCLFVLKTKKKSTDVLVN